MSTAVPQQDAVEVFLRLDEEAVVVIRQQAGLDEADVVLVAPENIDRVIRALRSVKREARDLKREGGL